jgi:predicted RNA-binding Zn-ribbon protein involved in translation (DUF1610 family)
MRFQIGETCPRCGQSTLHLTSVVPSPSDPTAELLSFTCRECGPILTREQRTGADARRRRAG